MTKKVLLWILGIAVTLIVIGVVIAEFALDTTTSKLHSMDSPLSKASNTKTNAGKIVDYLLIRYGYRCSMPMLQGSYRYHDGNDG